MRKYALAVLGITGAAVAAVLVGPILTGKGTASSHREAPLIPRIRLETTRISTRSAAPTSRTR